MYAAFGLITGAFQILSNIVSSLSRGPLHTVCRCSSAQAPIQLHPFHQHREAHDVPLRDSLVSVDSGA